MDRDAYGAALLNAPMIEEDAHFLRELARDALRIIEVGTFSGIATEIMLAAQPEGGELITIDTFEGTPGTATAFAASGATLARAKARLARFGSRVKIIKGESLAVARKIENGSADLVFLDAGHAYQSVRADILAWLPKVKPTGLIAGHDYDKAALSSSKWWLTENKDLDCVVGPNIHCGVTLAVDEAFERVSLAPNFFSSLWWAKPEWLRGTKREGIE